MKNSIVKTGAMIMLTLLTFSATALETSCRTIKLQCKEAATQDGDYSPLERSQCRDEKLECKDTLNEE